jgi:DNA-binding response OmpR family regulator
MARILVIDDDDSIRFSLKPALEDANHHVEDAGLETGFSPDDRRVDGILPGGCGHRCSASPN